MMTIEYEGVEKSLADWGLSKAMLYDRASSVKEFSVCHAGRAADAEPLFPYEGYIRVRQGGVLRGRKFTGGKLVFSGWHVTATAEGSGTYEQFDYLFQNAWRKLERITFGQAWRAWEVVDGVAQSRYIYTSKVHVPTRVDTATNTVARITNGEQVRDCVAWAIAKGVNLALGDFTPDLYLPVDAKKDLKCAEVIRMMLKLSPDAVCDIDESEAVPKFHCVRPQEMTPVTFQVSDEVIDKFKLTPRHDLLVPAVVLHYERVDEIDGRSFNLPPVVDAAPADATGFEEGAICQTIDLFGEKVTNVTQELDSEPIPAGPKAPEDKQWWIDHGVEWLDDVEDLVITGGDRKGALPYSMKPRSGGRARWMIDDNGFPGVTEEETFTALVSYRSHGNKNKNQKISARVRTTNLGPGVYRARKSEEAGENAVLGLAAKLLAGLSSLVWDGQITLTEEECNTDIGIRNTLNIEGGTGRYANMNAVVQEVVYNFDQGTRTIRVGWPNGLSIDDIIEIARFNRVRRVRQNPAVQGSGDVGENSDVELPAEPPMEDSGSGPQDYEAINAASDDYTVTLHGGNGSVKIRPGPVDGPATKALATGLIELLLADAGGKEIRIREYKLCSKGGVDYYVRMLGSDYYTKPAA